MGNRGIRMPRLLRHPLTGEPIVPVGYVSGKPVWPIMGGAPDDGDGDDDGDSGSGSGSGDGGSGDGSDRSGGSSNSGGSGNDGGDSGSGDGSTDDTTVSKAEFDALARRMQAADKRASDAESKVKEIEDAKKDDLTKAQDRVQELEKDMEERDETISQLRLENAFLGTNTHEWQDSDVAMSIARSKGFLEDIVDDKGEVDKKSLKASLDKLAKEHAYLVKEKKDDDSSGGSSGSSGPGRSNNSKDQEGRRQELRRRFPAVNR